MAFRQQWQGTRLAAAGGLRPSVGGRQRLRVARIAAGARNRSSPGQAPQMQLHTSHMCRRLKPFISVNCWPVEAMHAHAAGMWQQGEDTCSKPCNAESAARLVFI